MIKAPIGTKVYFKKSNTHYENTEIAYIIIGYKTKKSGILKAILESGRIVSFGELTEKPCILMQCGNCLYHNRRSPHANQ